MYLMPMCVYSIKLIIHHLRKSLEAPHIWPNIHEDTLYLTRMSVCIPQYVKRHSNAAKRSIKITKLSILQLILLRSMPSKLPAPFHYRQPKPKTP